MTVTAQKPKNLGNNFEAIRILAALTVLVSHHFALTGQAEPSFLHLHSWGGAAVLVFFIVSGYLVTASWYNDPNFLRFGLRRFLRIWPALTVITIITAYGLGAWVTTLPLAEYWKHRATLDYLSILWMKIYYVLPGVFENNPYARGVNGSLWTIPIEVKCYVVMALVGLIGLMRSKKIWLLMIAVYMIWFLVMRSADFTGKLNYEYEFSTFFLAGSALYVLRSRWESRPWLWLLLLGVAAAVVWSMGWRYTALLLLFPFLIVYVGTRSSPVIRAAGRWGDPSYGIYLIAFPVQQTIIHFLWSRLDFNVTMIMAMIITVVLAYLSWHGIEKRALKLKPRKV
jgi:peptidoglycan/LPS O-acetylase OafA/YrhL